ncbi:phage Gp19/Gp15/Gp42 family protein [Facklamia hominis]|uniref:Phage Gp19/Gp15/Gp42 family protein n=1 Tax=Facklamia hominis TaxID=178214 RepID=A0AAJ1V2X7_9LACT|nr:phage Gp19/Gp15/Gp42 family protein [Facklamia hominis]MDK7186861.1 phage Gp19/Gp15/Gp42 family protein [Facklamia hominis]
MAYIKVEDVIELFRPLSPEELARAKALIPVVEDTLYLEAEKIGKNLDVLSNNPRYMNVLKGVVVDIVARTLMTSTNSEPMIQYSEAALGYSASGTFLSPGGGIFIKKDELKKLGLRKQRRGAFELYGEMDQRADDLLMGSNRDWH